MPGNNQFSIGKQTQITINSLVGVLTFNILVEADFKPQYKEVSVEGVDGIVRKRFLPAGHTFNFTLDRNDSSAEDYFAVQEAGFFANLPPDNILITQTITEADGSVTQYQYLGVSLKLDDAGTWKGLDKVNQKIGGFASQKIKVS